MTIEDDKNRFYPDEEDDASGSGEGTGTGTGGQSGEIHFRFQDAASLGPRDDMLPLHEINRLLTVHKDLHKSRVDSQKIKRKERVAAKEGRLKQLASYQQRMLSQGGGSNYKTHPISNRAQFAGIDPQVNLLNNNVETNAENRDKLDHRFQHQNIPKFNPKPRPPGG